MKKILLSTVIVSLILGCASTQAITSGIEKGYISVNTSATTEIAPDVAEISIAVQTFDNKSMQKATLQNKEISEKIITELKSIINTNNGDFIKTSNYNASPVYKYIDSKQLFDKYQVSNSVIIHTKSIDKVGSMIDKAISLGATNVNSLNFSVTDYEDQCNELLSQAVKKAQKRVNSVAKAVPTTVTGIKQMDISCNANNSYTPQYRMLKSNMVMDSVGESTSTTIEKGVIKINANVNASYFVN